MSDETQNTVELSELGGFLRDAFEEGWHAATGGALMPERHWSESEARRLSEALSGAVRAAPGDVAILYPEGMQLLRLSRFAERLASLGREIGVQFLVFSPELRRAVIGSRAVEVAARALYAVRGSTPEEYESGSPVARVQLRILGRQLFDAICEAIENDSGNSNRRGASMNTGE